MSTKLVEKFRDSLIGKKAVTSPLSITVNSPPIEEVQYKELCVYDIEATWKMRISCEDKFFEDAKREVLKMFCTDTFGELHPLLSELRLALHAHDINEAIKLLDELESKTYP